MNETLINVGETFEFISGYKDNDGTVHKDFEIRELNGTDEEAIAKPDIKSNGGKVIRTLLERCILRIGTIYKSDVNSKVWQSIIQQLAVGDQDYALLKLRQISIGEEIETRYNCTDSECKEDIIVSVDIDELEVTPFNGLREIEFELPKGFKDSKGNILRKGKLRQPNGLDREVLDPIIRKNVGLANTLMLSRCIVELEGIKVYDELVRSLSMKDRNYLMDVIKENRFGVNLDVEVECPTCYNTFKASLNVVNFL